MHNGLDVQKWFCHALLVVLLKLSNPLVVVHLFTHVSIILCCCMIIKCNNMIQNYYKCSLFTNGSQKQRFVDTFSISD